MVVVVFVISKLPVIDTDPVNSEPLTSDSTMNPLISCTDAVTLPVAILVESSESADSGISNKSLPLPLNEPVCNFISPIKVEPLSIEVTTKPSVGDTDAVTEPLSI